MVIKLYTLDDLSFRCKYILLFVNKSCILIPELCEKGVVFHGKSISFPDDIFYMPYDFWETFREHTPYEWKVLMPNMVENWTSMCTCNGLLGVILNFWIKRHSSDHFMFIWTLLTNKLFFIFYNFYTVHIWCHVFEQINCFNLYKWWWRKKIKIKYKTDESFSRCITPQRPTALKEKFLIGQNFKLVYFLQ